MRPPPGVSSASSAPPIDLDEAAGDGQPQPDPVAAGASPRRWKGANTRSCRVRGTPGPVVDDPQVDLAVDRRRLHQDRASSAGRAARRSRPRWRAPAPAARRRRATGGRSRLDAAAAPGPAGSPPTAAGTTSSRPTSTGRGADGARSAAGSCPAGCRSRRVSRSAESSTIARAARAVVLGASWTSGCAALDDRRLDAGQRGAQVVATRRRAARCGSRSLSREALGLLAASARSRSRSSTAATWAANAPTARAGRRPQAGTRQARASVVARRRRRGGRRRPAAGGGGSRSCRRPRTVRPASSRVTRTAPLPARRLAERCSSSAGAGPRRCSTRAGQEWRGRRPRPRLGGLPGARAARSTTEATTRPRRRRRPRGRRVLRLVDGQAC